MSLCAFTSWYGSMSCVWEPQCVSLIHLIRIILKHCVICLHVSLCGSQYQQLPCHILFLMIILKQINAVLRFLRKLIWSSYRISQNVYCFHLLWCILLCCILLLLSKRYKIQKDFRCVLIKFQKTQNFCISALFLITGDVWWSISEIW